MSSLWPSKVSFIKVPNPFTRTHGLFTSYGHYLLKLSHSHWCSSMWTPRDIFTNRAQGSLRTTGQIWPYLKRQSLFNFSQLLWEEIWRQIMNLNFNVKTFLLTSHQKNVLKTLWVRWNVFAGIHFLLAFCVRTLDCSYCFRHPTHPLYSDSFFNVLKYQWYPTNIQLLFDN